MRTETRLAQICYYSHALQLICSWYMENSNYYIYINSNSSRCRANIALLNADGQMARDYSALECVKNSSAEGVIPFPWYIRRLKRVPKPPPVQYRRIKLSIGASAKQSGTWIKNQEHPGHTSPRSMTLFWRCVCDDDDTFINELINTKRNKTKCYSKPPRRKRNIWFNPTMNSYFGDANYITVTN